MASTYLTRTQSSSPTSDKIGTVSFWIKKSGIDTSQNIYWSAIFQDANNRTQFFFTTTQTLKVLQKVSAVTTIEIETSRVFRDTNAWYHVVYAFDTTQATSSDRVKLYVNGVQETSFSISTYPSLNETIFMLKGTDFTLGAYNGGTSSLDGSMAHVHFIDGTAYDSSAFGETDATTGIWKPKTAPSVTYGTNGFFLKFENSGSMGTDSSGNANNFTVNGTMTQTIDTPSNVFATMNPLLYESRDLNYSNGNNTISDSGSAGNWTTRHSYSTLGISKGKYYAEFKIANIGTNLMYVGLISNPEESSRSSSLGTDSNGIAYFSQGEIYANDVSLQSLATYTTNDIIGLAFDATNGTAQWYKNGSAVGSQETGLDTTANWFFACNYNSTGSINANFGNGYFGTTAVSSAQNPDDGIGIFEHTVPSGYKSLCTKSINAQEYD